MNQYCMACENEVEATNNRCNTCGSPTIERKEPMNISQLTAVLEGALNALKKINELETQIALANSQLRAIQDSNNQLAEIAFDENKFPQQLLDKVDDVARRAAKDEAEDAVDIDNLAHEVVNQIDISEEVARHVERLDLVSEDTVGDMVDDRIESFDFKTESEVEDLIENYLNYNDYICKSDIQDMIQEEITDLEEQIAARVLQLIAN